MCFAPQRRALFRHFFDIWTSKSGPRPSVLTLLTWKCASRHNGVHFFDIGTSKSGPTMVCFVHFDFNMCFAPQRRALFRHRNFQKWSDIGVFCTFWLQNVLRATTACTFSTSQLPKVVRSSSVLSILTWKCASRHNGVHFFMSHLASWLRTRRFSEPTFRPSGATNHWKNTVNRGFPIFSRICILFLLILSLLTRLTSAFQLSILSEVSLLNFLRQLQLQHTTTTNANATNTQLHYTTLHYINYITLHYSYNYNYNCSCNYKYNYHYITLHYTSLRFTNYTTLQLQLHYFTLHYTTPYHTTVHNATVHYTALITPLHHATTTTATTLH